MDSRSHNPRGLRICDECGVAASAGDVACAFCGSTLTMPSVAPPQRQTLEAAADNVSRPFSEEKADSGTANVAAVSWIRFSAFAVDVIFVAIFSFIIVFAEAIINFITGFSASFFLSDIINIVKRTIEEITGFKSSFFTGSSPYERFVLVTLVITPLMYFFILNSGNRQTLLKKLFGIRTVNMQGRGLGYGKSFIRFLLTFSGILMFFILPNIGLSVDASAGLSFLVLLVDALPSVFRKDRRTIHDLLVNTQVINTNV